ncbi:hypothetical protein VFPPC_17094 [Pochonia chlamydosporia 170]|uniref:Uncharacterized protein n=1 Tax=Pochonia chlamydosporia 170 TaxID=1380566 RepID=A0A179EXM1_METCM|nr:hypothetical protein VFPPC_17094 [Pochonia chlamydosporia 170]OAQ57760.1 hypothetical protein VFPPC_17094 [Pochonia chlamydosporia 170]
MSVVSTEILRYHYDNAITDIKHKSFRFWQHYLHNAVADTEVYSTTYKTTTEGSRTPVYMQWHGMTNHMMSALLWIECEVPGARIRQAEEQALEEAKTCVQRPNQLNQLHGICQFRLI